MKTLVFFKGIIENDGKIKSGVVMGAIIKKLEVILADTYALYLKTQNYHWHVKGVQFKSLHELFEMQYRALAEAIDQIAERILIMGHKAPATFTALNQLKTIKDGDSSIDANKMVSELAQDNGVLVKDLNAAIKLAQEDGDEGTVALLSERIAAHEKARWMLNASTV
nr:DNA starvation/stationary phase protection protein [Fluoribacter dumoffii]